MKQDVQIYNPAATITYDLLINSSDIDGSVEQDNYEPVI